MARDRDTSSLLRLLADQAFSRAAGAPLVAGNAVRILRDAEENYPAWMEALHSARRSIHFESYILHEDEVGRAFTELLAGKAREGVKVRVLYDWMGALGKMSRRWLKPMSDAGAEVRCFNPPRFDSPLGWLGRDHRKMIAVDGRIAFVTGLCVGRRWAGDPARELEPWRDTGVEVRGPAVADIERSFATMWGLAGSPLPRREIPAREDLSPEGDVLLRVIASTPNTANLYRLDHLVTVLARRSLWLTDAYFVATAPYVQALRAAARDRVDVRLLVPRSSDIPVLRAFSRALYPPLLEAGVRVFEWNGAMLHAKTAVADGRWARVGSTNLNLASWLGNWELDLAIEDEATAQAFERMYLEDLERATEVVLTPRRDLRPAAPARGRPTGLGAGSRVGLAAAGAAGIGSTVSAALLRRRILGPAQADLFAVVGLCLLLLALVASVWPRAVAVPLAVLVAWLGSGLLLRAHRLRREGRRADTGRARGRRRGKHGERPADEAASRS